MSHSVSVAAKLVRDFARATNLLVAGRRFGVRGDGPDADALADLLTRLGARRATEHPDYLFCFGPGVLTELPSTAGELVIVQAAPDAIALALGDELRPGVFATANPSVVVVVPGGGSTADADPVALAGRRIDWARRYMPVTASIARELGETVAGLRIGVSMVLEPKTAVLALALRDAGAEVSVFAHPDETDDAVAEALRGAGIPVDAHSDATPDEHLALALAFLDRGPQVLVDDGSHLIRLAHRHRPDLVRGLIGATEETTSGLRPLRDLEVAGALETPVIAANDARSKTLFDNLYGTGQSTIFAIADVLELDFAGRVVVVAGFGHVGQGVAHHARALGAAVTVAEVDPVLALRAVFAGYRVAPLIEAVASADVVISATGVAHTIGYDILAACASDAAIAVAGGVPQEIAIDAALAAGAIRQTVRPRVERFALPTGSSVLILDDGGCINITAAEGNPIQIMDLSFAVQLGAIRYLVESTGRLAPGVHALPADVDDRVAELALLATGERVDSASAMLGAGSAPVAERFAEGNDSAG